MKSINFNQHSIKRSQTGFSLIELMISITIGLLLLAALTTLFVGQSKSRLELDKSNRMIDNGRYALDLLSENLSMAGFYGELDPYTLTVYPTTDASFNPCSTAQANIEKALPWHVQGYNATTSTSTITSPPSCLPSTIKAGSDILVIRRANTATVPVTSAIAGTTFLQVSLCIPKSGASESVYRVQKAPATYNLSKKTCTTANSGPFVDLRRILVQIYFIDSNNLAGDGIPTLKMAELDETSNFVITPLVEGIEYMKVDYGIDGVDTDSDGIPDRFIATNTPPDVDGAYNGSYVPCTACNENQWAHVVSVKMNLISRNLEPTQGYTDSNYYSLGSAGTVSPGGAYKRHAYTQVIRLTNPSSRKE